MLKLMPKSTLDLGPACPRLHLQHLLPRDAPGSRAWPLPRHMHRLLLAPPVVHPSVSSSHNGLSTFLFILHINHFYSFLKTQPNQSFTLKYVYFALQHTDFLVLKCWLEGSHATWPLDGRGSTIHRKSGPWADAVHLL